MWGGRSPSRSDRDGQAAPLWSEGRSPKRLMWGGRSPSRSDGEAALRQRHEAAEDTHVGGPGGAQGDRRVVVVEAEAGSREPPVDGAAAPEVERGQIPGV